MIPFLRDVLPISEMSPGVFIFLFIIINCYSTYSVKCPGVAQYSLSFYGMWSATTHPNAYPKNGHFSPLVGCSHNKFYTMWDEGMTASKGVKDVAELGRLLCSTLKLHEKHNFSPGRCLPSYGLHYITFKQIKAANDSHQ